MNDILVAETLLSVAWSFRRAAMNPREVADLIIRELAVPSADHRQAYIAGLQGLNRALRETMRKL